MKRVFFISYITLIFGLFLYSYTQVDLSLTLSRISIWQFVEKAFQYIGYFQRPLSTLIYESILLLLFLSYFIFLRLVWKNNVSRRSLWIMIILIGTVLTFSYNAFSYDLFNYIFDAKIITYYHQNPYLHKALDFPSDPMLSFMHWTQRTYPYGPFWIVLTIPFSFLGLQFFLPTLFLFKAIATASYLGIAFFIEKILKRVSPGDSILGLAIFAFNPLVIIEGLVSSHNDITMIFLTTLAIWLLISKKYVQSLTSFTLSAAIKFASIFLLPIFVLVFYYQKTNKKINYELIFSASSILMLIPVVAAAIRTNFQPWYFLYVLPFASLVPRKFYITIPFITFSAFILTEYIPFLATGAWNPPIPVILNEITIAGIATSIIFAFIWKVLQYHHPQ